MAYIQREGLRQRRLERDGAALTPCVHGEILLLINAMFSYSSFRFGLLLRQRIGSLKSVMVASSLYVKLGNVGTRLELKVKVSRIKKKMITGMFLKKILFD